MNTKSWTFPALAGVGATIFASLIFFGAVAHEDQPPYAQTYMEALDQFPGEPLMEKAHLERFLKHFIHMADVSQPTRESLYAKKLYFSDGLLTTYQRDTVFQHFDAMHDNAVNLDLRVIDTVNKGSDVYLIWSAQLSFVPLFRTVTSQSIGITHLRFNALGQVVLQQDYWDTAEAFYKQLPVVGTLVRQIGVSLGSYGQ